MARDRRKYVLGLDKDSCPVYGKSQVSDVQPMSIDEIRKWVKENPLSSLEVFELTKIRIQSGVQRRPNTFYRSFRGQKQAKNA